MSRQHWAIRLRLRLLVPGSHRWNAWVRDLTARLERASRPDTPEARTSTSASHPGGCFR